MPLSASVKLLRSVVRGLLSAPSVCLLRGSSLCAPRYWWRGLCMASLAATSLWSGVMFSDSTFNPSDYSIITWKSDPSIMISVGQTQTGGNPGQALQILYSLPAGSGNSMLGLPRPSFTYNPATQGAVQSVDFSIEKYVTYTGCSSCQFDSTNTARLLILQSGTYYMAVVPLPGSAGTYLKATATGLRASDFGLFDFKTGTLNTAVNPNFNNGVMQFGVAIRYLFQFDTFAQAETRLDNLTINVQSVAPPSGPTITFINLPISNAPHLSPGAPMYIVGSNLGASSTDAAAITIGGKTAPVTVLLSAASLLAQVPVDLPTGSTTVTATYKGQASTPFNVTVDAFSPAIYNVAPSFTDSAGTPITASHPAVPGVTVSCLAIGLGATNPPMVTGVKATAPAPTKTPVQVMAGNKMVLPDYAGLMVGSVTDYLVTFKVPSDVAAGDQQVTISVGGVASNAVTLQVGLPVPVVNAIVNGATFLARGAAPNSFVSFFGLNYGSQDTPSNIFPATNFSGISVLFNGVEAPLYFVFGAAGQINLVVPSELPESGTVSVQVKNAQGTSSVFLLKMAPTDVGLFRIGDPSNPKRNNGAVLFANTAWKVMPASMATAIGFSSCEGLGPAATCGQPAMVGDTLQIYVTGLGKATPDGDPNGKPLPTGSLAPNDGNPLYKTVQTPTVTIGGIPAQPSFSGIAPGNAGLYQINVAIPDGVQPGDDVQVVVTMPGGSTDTVTIAVRAN